MADSVFLAGKIIVTAEAQGAASSIQNEIKNAKSAIDTFNQNSKLIIDIDKNTAARISVMRSNLQTITTGLTELKQASASFQNIELGVDRLIGSFELLGITAKEVSELMLQKIRPALNIPDTTVKSVENYAAALDLIAKNAGALGIIKKTPAVSVNTPTSPTSQAVIPIPVGTGSGPGGPSPASITANQQAAEKYRQTLQEVYDNLVKTFLAARGSDQDTFWVKNKVAIVASLKALMDYHKETGNVIAQGKDLEKMIQN
jgi:ABC-type transporter Mla subunit MlaD